MPIYSINIGDTAVRMLGVEKKAVKLAVTMPLEPGLVKNGVIFDKEALVAVIRALLEANRISARKVLASVSGLHSIYRFATLPRMSAQLLEEAVKREAERVMPVSPGELYLSWQALPITDEETLICFLGLPKNSVDGVVDVLQGAGLVPQVVEARPLAAARTLGEERGILVNVEADDFDIVITVDSIPELALSLDFSRDDLTPEEKAREVKSELERAVRFYNSGHEGAPMPDNVPLVLGGEGSEVIGLLGQEAAYPVKPLSTFFSYPPDFDPLPYMTNIGLVLRGVKADLVPDKLNLNSLPETYLPKPVPLLPVVSAIVIVAAIILLVWLGLAVNTARAQTMAMRSELGQVQSQVQELAKATQVDPKEVTRLENRLKEVNTSKDSLRQTVSNLEKQRAKTSSDLGKAVSLLPGGVTLVSASSGSGVSIQGTAPDDVTILNYARSLSSSSRFSQVLVSFETKAFRVVSFTITLN